MELTNIGLIKEVKHSEDVRLDDVPHRSVKLRGKAIWAQLLVSRKALNRAPNLILREWIL